MYTVLWLCDYCSGKGQQTSLGIPGSDGFEGVPAGADRCMSKFHGLASKLMIDGKDQIPGYVQCERSAACFQLGA